MSDERLRHALAIATACSTVALTPLSSWAANETCETVVVERAGYARDPHGNAIAIPDSDMVKWEIVVRRCPKGRGTWEVRSRSGFAHNIVFPKYGYWCVVFTDNGADFHFIRAGKSSDCL